jgi:hypothetical protein
MALLGMVVAWVMGSYPKEGATRKVAVGKRP